MPGSVPPATVLRLRASLVDVYVLRLRAGAPEVLLLRRAAAGRCPGAWETVHGHVEDGEAPVAAARRELREETGLVPAALYNLSRVELFYQHRLDEVAVVPVFAAVVADGAVPRTGAEHDRAEWATLAEARTRFAWPRERRTLDDLEVLLGGGHAGPLEDALNVERAGA